MARVHVPALVRDAACGVTITLAVACCGAQARPTPTSTVPVPARATPARDSFSGRVRRAAGPGTGAAAAVTVGLHPGPAGAGTSRPLTLAVRAGCRGRRPCLTLGGTLTGTLTARRGLPDVGRTSAIRARGTLRGLGPVSAVGSVTGTGNVRSGRESLRLTLVGSGETVVLTARSAPVGSFTSP